MNEHESGSPARERPMRRGTAARNDGIADALAPLSRADLTAISEFAEAHGLVAVEGMSGEKVLTGSDCESVPLSALGGWRRDFNETSARFNDWAHRTVVVGGEADMARDYLMSAAELLEDGSFALSWPRYAEDRLRSKTARHAKSKASLLEDILHFDSETKLIGIVNWWLYPPRAEMRRHLGGLDCFPRIADGLYGESDARRLASAVLGELYASYPNMRRGRMPAPRISHIEGTFTSAQAARAIPRRCAAEIQGGDYEPNDAYEDYRAASCNLVERFVSDRVREATPEMRRQAAQMLAAMMMVHDEEEIVTLAFPNDESDDGGRPITDDRLAELRMGYAGGSR